MYRILKDTASEEYQYLREYLILSGGQQTLMRFQNMSPAEMQKAVLGERNVLQKIVGALDTFTDFLSLPVQTSEIMTRASEYIKARKSGKSQVVALEDAARVSAPFAHKGAGGFVAPGWEASLPYYKAAKQVLGEFGSALNDPKRRKRAIVAISLVFGAKIAEMAAQAILATPDQKEKFKDLAPAELSLYVYYPHPNGIDLLRFRVPEQIGGFAAVANMAMMEAMGIADYKGKEYVDAATAFIPDQWNLTDPARAFWAWIPQVFKPGVETIFEKKTWPTIRPMIPGGLQYKEARFQTQENSSIVAKALGEQLDLSPIKIDHLLEGYLGRSITYLTGKPGTLRKNLNPFLREVYFTSGRRVQRYYEIKDQTDKLRTSVQNKLRPFTSEERNRIAKNTARMRRIAKNLAAYRKITDMSSQSAAELRALILNDIDALEEYQ